MSIEAMKQALEALEMLARYENPETKIQVRKPKDGGPIMTMYPHKVATDAATVLRTAIAEAENVEPVAWVADGILMKIGIPEKYTGYLYATPQPQREWVGLTDGDIEAAYWQTNPSLERFAHAIEAKLKEKNT